MMYGVPDPYWKVNPDIVADESADERFIWDDEDCDEESEDE